MSIFQKQFTAQNIHFSKYPLFKKSTSKDIHFSNMKVISSCQPNSYLIDPTRKYFWKWNFWYEKGHFRNKTLSDIFFDGQLIY